MTWDDISQTLNPNAEALFETLRAWRTEQARPTKTPAFMILSDAVMRSIANTNPQTLSALNAGHLTLPEFQEGRERVRRGRDLHGTREATNRAYLRKRLGVVEKRIDVTLASPRHHLRGW